MSNVAAEPADGLSLAPFRGLRPTVDSARLGRLLSPPYDVVDAAERDALLAADPDNAIAVILPDPADGVERYAVAAERLRRWRSDGLLAVDAEPALYVYEMRTPTGELTRGLLGAVELRDPVDGVILPHESTMAGPVSDRLALMTATEANLEPIYLVYDGGGAASEAVRTVDQAPVLAETTTPDGIRHRLWAITEPGVHRAVAADLATRRALIADGHHRYATYRELQARLRRTRGAGPWDRGLTLLVDSSSYGPQVHAIHRVLVGVPYAQAASQIRRVAEVTPQPTVDDAMAAAEQTSGFAIVLTDGTTATLVTSPDPALVLAASNPDEPTELAGLDVSVLHRVLVPRVWGLADSVDTVGYAHSVAEAIESARASDGTAVLMRPTPVDAVAAVAAAGARMPRKSTLFTPKPASGLVLRAFADQPAEATTP
jgi:uncharacterized protein (DUF1015 family)